MRYKLFFITLACFMFSQANAMENEDVHQYINCDIFGAILGNLRFDKIVEIQNLQLVCSTWNGFFSRETTWEILFINKHGNNIKRINNWSYKKNYVVPLLVCHTAGARMSSFVEQPDSLEVFCEEIVTDTYLSIEQCQQVYTQALSLCPQVFVTCFCLYQSNSKLSEYYESIFEHAKAQDTLVVVPIGNGGREIIIPGTAIDLHKAYPNVVWTFSCQDENNVSPWSNVGDLAKVGIVADGTVSAAMLLSIKFALLRRMRPDLSAYQIRSLVCETGKKLHDPENKLPNGKLLDFEAAKRTIKTYGEKISNTSPR